VTTAVGIDIGATKIAAGLVEIETGNVLDERREPTRARDGGAAVLGRCVELARTLAAPETCGVGVGLCELVDPGGRPASGYAVDWRSLDVEAAFSPLPVRIESDVRAAALAEARFGAGRPFTDFIYLSVGSGVSHCLVEDGRPRPGRRGNALVVGAPPVEELASGPALARAAGVARAEEVFADPGFRSLAAEAATHLGYALAFLINALDPEAAIIGGGLGAVDEYRDQIVSVARTAIFAETTAALPILQARLGNRSGLIGAALVAGASHGEAVLHDRG
jgi:glucokinase